jgi:hypothetical protein
MVQPNGDNSYRNYNELIINCCVGFCLFLYFLVILGFEHRALHLPGQVLYHLSHASSPFCFSYFSCSVSHLCLGWSGPWSSHLCPNSWDYTCATIPRFIGWDNFLPGLDWNFELPCLCLLCCWDHKCEHHTQLVFWEGLSLTFCLG